MGVIRIPGSPYWYTNFIFDGKPVRRTTKTKIKKKAEEIERKIRSQLEDDRHNNMLGRPVNRTYGDALLKWLKGGAPKSMLSHARNTRPHLEHVRLVDCVPAATTMKEAMIAAGLSPQTINRRLSVVRRILNLAYRQWGWLKEPLGEKIELMSEKGCDRHIYLTREQVTELLSSLTDDVMAFLLLLSYTGMRKSEARRINLAEHWRPPNIRLDSKTKGGKPKVVPLHENLHWVMEYAPFDFTEHKLRSQFEAARARMGHSEWRMHDLRHTFASWLAENPSVALTTIRDLLGHSSLAVTSRYAHLREDSRQAAINSLRPMKKPIKKSGLPKGFLRENIT